MVNRTLRKKEKVFRFQLYNVRHGLDKSEKLPAWEAKPNYFNAREKPSVDRALAMKVINLCGAGSLTCNCLNCSVCLGIFNFEKKC